MKTQDFFVLFFCSFVDGFFFFSCTLFIEFYLTFLSIVYSRDFIFHTHPIICLFAIMLTFCSLIPRLIPKAQSLLKRLFSFFSSSNLSRHRSSLSRYPPLLSFSLFSFNYAYFHSSHLNQVLLILCLYLRTVLRR